MKSGEYGKPFIKKFSDGGFYYVYDVNTNRIIEVEKPVYDIIDEYDDDNAGEIYAAYKGIYQISVLKHSIEEIKNAIMEQGLFSNFRPEKVALGARTSEEVKKLHENGLHQILLEITRECNHNCGYCSTSGKYANQGKSPNYMSEMTCRHAVDFFCERAFNSEKPFISFYGGEPLLRFDLIRNTVAYVNKRHGKNKFNFNLTTNGTRLNKKIMDFLIENDIRLMVSLDGPQKINDRYRRFKNGKGTFNRIMKNLEFLK